MALAWRDGGIDGGGFCNVIAQDGAGHVIVGSDVGGIHWSADYGRTWSPANGSFYNAQLLSCASLEWSATVAGRAFACVGKQGAGGGFYRSDDYGKTWALLSTAVQFSGSNNVSPLPVPHPRSTGRLLALDEAGGYIYVASYSDGVWRSTDGGSNWTRIGMTTHYTRGLRLDPTNANTLYVCSYGAGSGLTTPGIYKSTNPRGPGISFNQMTGANSPTTPEDIMVTTHNTILYVTDARNGIKKYNGTSWSVLLNDGAAWESVDGYASGSNDVLIFGCFDPVKDSGSGQFDTLVRSADSGSTLTYPMRTATNIKTTIFDANGATWWLSVKQQNQLLGKGSSVGALVQFDPIDRTRVMVAGRAGAWTSPDSGVTWYPAVKSLSVTINRAIAAVPGFASEVVIGNTDWTYLESTDHLLTVVQNSPSPNTGFAVACDPTDGTVYLSDGDRDDNALGKIWSAVHPGSGTWTDLAVQGTGGFLTDTFQRTVSSGWGTADSGGAWTGSSANFNVAPGGGTVAITAVGSQDLSQTGLNLLEPDGTFSVSWSVNAAGGFHAAFANLRRATNNSYDIRLRQETNGNVLLAIAKRVAGTITVLGSEVTLATSSTAGVVWNVKWQVRSSSPTTLRAKAWLQGATEPDTWAIDLTDNDAALQSSGQVMIKTQGASGYTANATFTYYSVLVQDNSNTSGAGGKRSLGVGAGRDGSNNKVVLAAVQQLGIRRLVSGTWSTVSTAAMQNAPSHKHASFAWAPGSVNVYMMDPDSGVYRSTDRGVTWALIWSKTTTADGTGYVVSPDGIQLYCSFGDTFSYFPDATVGVVT